MSMVLTTRSPLGPIDMNGAGTSKRRSARLSHEGAEENEPPVKKTRTSGAQSATISTKEQDGDANSLAKRRPKKSYDEEVDGFAFKKGGRRLRETKKAAAVAEEKAQSPGKIEPAKVAADIVEKPAQAPVTLEKVPAPTGETVPKPAPKKTRRRFPTTPERDAAEKNVRRSKRLSDEHKSSDSAPSPIKLAHAKSHANTGRSPSPERARPVTVEKKRKRVANGAEEEEKIMRIALPFQDTPVIKRNKEMRKSTAVDGHRRSSSGMRGRRASSLMDEGRGNARVIQEELSQDLITKGTLSDWFSRDDSVPSRVPLRKKPNPRNIVNAAKAKELERELERLKAERAQWSTLAQSALPPSSPPKSDATLSPLHPDLLDSPQRAIYEQLQSPASDTAPEAIQSRLRSVAQGLEFSIDSFAHGVHALSNSIDVAGALADKTLSGAAETLESREKEKRAHGKGVDALDALKALGRVMNGRANGGTGR